MTMNRWLCASLIAFGIQHPGRAATNDPSVDSTLPDVIARYLTMDNREARERYLSEFALNASEAIYHRVRDSLIRERDFWGDMSSRNPQQESYLTNADFYQRALAENLPIEELMRLYPVESQTIQEARALLAAATSDYRLLASTLKHYDIALSNEVETKMGQRFAWYGLHDEISPPIPHAEIARLERLYVAQKEIERARFPEALAILDKLFDQELFEDAVSLARDIPKKIYAYCDKLEAQGRAPEAYRILASLEQFTAVAPYLERDRDWETRTMRRIRIAESRKHYRWSKKIWTAVERGEIFKGMTREQVRASWGEPIPGKAVSFPPNCEQWVYSPGSFLLFEKGILTLYRI